MNITSAESAVMDVLWRLGPTDADRVTEVLSQSAQWSRATVRTLLQRLVDKGAVSRGKGAGGLLIFTPLLAREAYVLSESEGLVDRLFGGRFGPLAAQFAEQGKLTEEDIAELKAIIARIEDGR